MSVEITKYEKIIFQERDVEGAKFALKEWKEYANGERNVYSENADILSDCEETIAALSLEITNLSDEPINWCDWIYDIYYENDFSSRDEFVSDYQAILRQKAQKHFNGLIEYYSPENSKLQCVEARADLEREQSKLNLMIGELNFIERFRLNILRKSPTARINSSPSFITCHFGDLIADGFAEGLNSAK